VGQDFQLGVQVSILGMGLVFATLIIGALIIRALGLIFRAKAEVEIPGSTPDVIPHAVQPPASNLAASAAAIAVAIALAQRQTKPLPKATVSYDDEDISGEIVNVVTIQSSHDVWSGSGRLKAAQ
jgi:sodium pump decarboxylase gamma subunit